MSTTALRRLGVELFDYERPETAGERIFFRLFELFVAGSVIQMAWDWGLYIGRISDVVLPLGIANYIDVSFMFGNSLALVNAAVITALVIAGFVRGSRYAYFGALLLLHLQFATRFTLGEIPHSSNAIGMVLLGLSLAMVLFPDDLHRRRFTLGFTYFFIGLGYSLAAVCKLLATGLTWSDGRHLWLWVYEKAVDRMGYTGELFYGPFQELVLGSLTVATVFLTIGLVSEMLAWGTWFRRFRTPAVLAVIGLHVGIHLVMNIMFWHTFYLLILLAVPWHRLIDAVVSFR